MVILILTLLGLALGSFINALVWRIHEKRDFVKERSVCVHCEHTLEWYDLVPLFSWLWLRGQCRYCSKKISWQYPAVELATASLFVVSYLVWPYDLSFWQEAVVFAFWLVQLVGLITLFVYDIRWMILPNTIVYSLIALALFQRSFELIFIADNPALVFKEVALGALVGGGLFYLLYIVSKGRWIGGGDVKLGFLIGILLGPKLALIALLIAFYSAAIFILPLMALKKLSRKSKVPFGPFLIFGLIITMLASEKLLEIFDNFLGL